MTAFQGGIRAAGEDARDRRPVGQGMGFRAVWGCLAKVFLTSFLRLPVGKREGVKEWVQRGVGCAICARCRRMQSKELPVGCAGADAHTMADCNCVKA